MFNFFDECFGGIVEEEVSFVEEENEFGLFWVANFGEFFKELAEEPEEECRVELWTLHEFVGGEDVDNAFAVWGSSHEVIEVEGRFSEKVFAALLFEDEECALD